MSDFPSPEIPVESIPTIKNSEQAHVVSGESYVQFTEAKIGLPIEGEADQYELKEVVIKSFRQNIEQAKKGSSNNEKNKQEARNSFKNEIRWYTKIPLQSKHLLRALLVPPEELLFLVLEKFGNGETLESVVKLDLDHSEILEILEQIVEGLEELYALQLGDEQVKYHRDLKPGNCLVKKVDGKYRIKLSDFSLVNSEGWAGTPLYMAPELLLDSNVELSCQVDVFALGVMAYQFFSKGKHPFIVAGNSSEENVIRLVNSRFNYQQLQVRKSKSSDKSLGYLDQVLQKSLEKYTENRYRTPREFFDELKKVFLRESPSLDTLHEEKNTGKPEEASKLKGLGRFFARRRR